MNPGKIHLINKSCRVRLLLVSMASIVSRLLGTVTIIIRSEGHRLLMFIRFFQKPIASQQHNVARALLFGLMDILGDEISAMG